MSTKEPIEALIADARSRAESLRQMFPNDGEVWDDARLIEGLADALEASAPPTPQITDEMVDAAAIAIVEANPHPGGGSTVVWEDAEEWARAALAAALRPEEQGQGR